MRRPKPLVLVAAATLLLASCTPTDLGSAPRDENGWPDFVTKLADEIRVP